MHDELTHMISADKLLDPKDQQQYSMLSEMGDKISDGDVVWMMDTYWKGKQKFYQSTPDFEDLLIDSSLIHGVDKLSQDFNQKSHCFGFDVPDYNNAFLPYEKKLAELLGERIKSIRSNLSIDRRETATAIADNLKSRVQFVYGSTLFTRTRLPILTPNTFRPMAETFMRFPDAITEVSR
jgi:hypothetical protein